MDDLDPIATFKWTEAIWVSNKKKQSVFKNISIKQKECRDGFYRLIQHFDKKSK